MWLMRARHSQLTRKLIETTQTKNNRDVFRCNKSILEEQEKRQAVKRRKLN